MGALNEAGADIYWTPNNFSEWGARKKENLTEITCFFCEIDSEDKQAQIKSLQRCGLIPSCVIETKRGFHIYWYLKEPIDCRADPIAKADWFRGILKNRICPALGADTNAADASRILRAAFFKYWKDGKGTFVSDIVFESNKRYMVEDILRAFPEEKKKSVYEKPRTPFQVPQGDETFWVKANQIPARQGLEMLSGRSEVNGESYSFVQESPKRTRILVAGNKINAWIDESGKIGSTDRGGPAIPNWLLYYQHDWKAVAQTLKDVFGLS